MYIPEEFRRHLIYRQCKSKAIKIMDTVILTWWHVVQPCD